MKTIRLMLFIALTAQFAGCEYPVSNVDNISLTISVNVNEATKEVIATAQIPDAYQNAISEKGFCYTYHNYRIARIPTIEQKHLIETEPFSWGFIYNEEFNVAYIRAYIIVDGIVIYSDTEPIRLTL